MDYAEGQNPQKWLTKTEESPNKSIGNLCITTVSYDYQLHEMFSVVPVVEIFKCAVKWPMPKELLRVSGISFKMYVSEYQNPTRKYGESHLDIDWRYFLQGIRNKVDFRMLL